MKNIKKVLALTLVAISLLAIAAPALAVTTGVYNTAAVNLRSTMGGSSSQGLVNKGATCNILMEDELGGTKWYKVTITSHTTNDTDLYGKTGWSQARYITPSGSIPTGPQSATEAFGTANLSTGSVGNYVRNVQMCLLNGRDSIGKPYYTGNIDGDFGSLTYAAVCKFQEEHDLFSDGVVGPLTRNKLFALYSQFCIY